MITTMKQKLFYQFKEIAKVLVANYSRSAKLNGTAKFGKNRESFYDFIFKRNAAPSMAFGYNQNYFKDGVFLDSGFAQFSMNLTPLKFMPNV